MMQVCRKRRVLHYSSKIQANIDQRVRVIYVLVNIVFHLSLCVISSYIFDLAGSTIYWLHNSCLTLLQTLLPPLYSHLKHLISPASSPELREEGQRYIFTCNSTKVTYIQLVLGRCDFLPSHHFPKINRVKSQYVYKPRVKSQYVNHHYTYANFMGR